jgi:integrase/recombinase XerD
MEKRKRKTVRTNRAVSVEELEALEVVAGISIVEAMSEFIHAKQAERSAPRTIRDYQTHFRYLRTWLDKFYPKVTLSEIKPTMIREYVNWMTNGKELYDDHPQERKKRGIIGLSPMTVNVRIRNDASVF